MSIKKKYKKFITREYFKLNSEYLVCLLPKVNQNIELDNDGERLVPGFSHDAAEIIRHRSTYNLYKKIIVQDMVDDSSLFQKTVNILDLGCGCGHGASFLANIPNTKIYAVDISENAINYAKNYYPEDNIEYICSTIEDFAKNNEVEFDYVVSRGVLEHVDAGVDIALEFECKKRYMVSVPYKEKPGNTHHIHLEMDENIFNKYSNSEFIYEDLNGESDNKVNEKTNLFTCISSKQGRKINEFLEVPLKSYELKGVEKIYLNELIKQDS